MPIYRSALESVSNRPPFTSVLRRCTRSAPLLIAASLLAATPSQAQEERIRSPYRWIERGLRVGLFGGYHNGSRGNLEYGQGPTSVAGARFRVRISSPLSLELGAGYAGAERWVIDPRLTTGPAPVDTVSASWLRLEAGVQLALTGRRTWNRLQPYAVFGGGFVIGLDEQIGEPFEDEALRGFVYEIGTAPALFAGVGVELFASDRITLGLEVRDYLVRLRAPDGWFAQDILTTIEEAGAEAPKRNQWAHSPEFAVVLWWYP